jgi:hypothetical protein
LLLTAGIGLIALIPFSALIVGPTAKATLNMRTKLQAEQIGKHSVTCNVRAYINQFIPVASTGAGVPNRGQDEFNKQLKKWSTATEVSVQTDT